MKNITGVFVTPDNTPIVNATIRFIATSNTIDGAIKGTMFSFVTDGSGAYNVNILPGDYLVDFKNPNKSKYIKLGNVNIVTGGSAALEDLGIS